MLNKIWSNKFTRLLTILALGVAVSFMAYAPYIYRYITQGIVFSGSGDGYRQMMPFQMYLYEHISQFKSFYDHSFGLGGDYIKDLSYYYATSPFTYINFIFVWISETVFHANPHSLHFWATNQLIVSFFKGVAGFVIAFYYFRYLRFKFVTTFISAMLFGASTTMIHFNFTWSYYGDLFIFLPLSLWGLERLFKERKAGLFIFAIALTLFSNFYFSYYEAIVVLAYYIYRCVYPHPQDSITRKQKLWVIPIAVFISTLIGIWGFYTGVSSFLNNDRVSNPHFKIEMFTNFARQKHFFSNGFYITVSIIAVVALLSFKLYRHYYYRLFAVATWIMLIGSLTPYFDSMFNGFSTPERRWVYILALTTAGLIALFIQHLSELTFKDYVYACTPTLLIMFVMSLVVKNEVMTWMYVCLVLMLFIGLILFKRKLMTKPWTLITLVALLLIQQIVILSNDHHNNVVRYESTLNNMNDSSYKSKALNQSIKQVNEKHSDDPLSRIDYMSAYGLNSPMIYHFDGIALYSSIFDGDILKYYDKQLQINMPVDKNSTYRLMSNRANEMALWDVKDRFRRPNDLNMSYGFKQHDIVKHSDKESFIHSTNQIDYPSAHIAHKVYDKDELKSPLDREQAMLKGVVFNDNKHKANSHLKLNQNLLNKTKSELHNAHRDDKGHLIIEQDKGGVSYHLPSSIANKYKDMYVEMDVELLSPDKQHDVAVNEYNQHRNELSYKYRRFVSPVTMRVKANQNLDIKLSKGQYLFNIKGIYGENYHTLKQATHRLDKVDVKQTRSGYTIHKDKNDHGYIVLPMAYREGMHAQANGKQVPVQQGNGIMTVIPVEKGQQTIKLSYTPPHTLLLILLSSIGIILSIGFTWWLRHKLKVKK
ncbi:YfhO family protein [Staphylococcus sp. HKU1]|uniref:YfhO family protein n=1 Tax=Staphylococcus sp. HKU1 TaxID=3068989 RepID=UPI003AAD0804